jgi:hypothetical protein
MPAHQSPRGRAGPDSGTSSACHDPAAAQNALAGMAMRESPGRTRVERRTLGDGWLGTHELPGYRAGCVVAKLEDLPEVDPAHLYFDLLLLDCSGRPQHAHSGPCLALAREGALEQRSRFVRVVAELLRHAPCEDRGLSAVAPALDFIRQGGIDPDRLVTAAQLLDNACSERAVTASLSQMLELSLGHEEARRALNDVVASLATTSGFGAFDGGAPDGDAGSCVEPPNESGLVAQVSHVVRTVGKARARRYLRDATDFALVPRPDMFGV